MLSLSKHVGLFAVRTNWRDNVVPLKSFVYFLASFRPIPAKAGAEPEFRKSKKPGFPLSRAFALTMKDSLLSERVSLERRRQASIKLQ
jgi:hypothetical protein